MGAHPRTGGASCWVLQNRECSSNKGLAYCDGCLRLHDCAYVKPYFHYPGYWTKYKVNSTATTLALGHTTKLPHDQINSHQALRHTTKPTAFRANYASSPFLRVPHHLTHVSLPLPDLLPPSLPTSPCLPPSNAPSCNHRLQR